MNEILRSILDGINSVVGNYGWSIILFTLFIKLILLPLDAKSRKSMRRTQQIQPQLTKLQKKYANDKDKLNQKTMELYKKENISPMSSCWPMLLTMPVLFAMFAAMRMIANQELAKQVLTYLQGETPVFEGWLWVKNLWMPDSPFTALVPDASSISNIPRDIWQSVYEALSQAQRDLLPQFLNAEGVEILYDFSTDETMKTVVSAMTAYMTEAQAYKDALAVAPGWGDINLIFTTVSIYVNNNGLFLLPVLAAGTQFLTTMLTPTTAAPASTGEEGQAPAATPGGGFMKWFFPLFSLFICSSYNAGFSLYWVASNIIAALQTLLLNKYFDAQDRKKAMTAGEGTVK